MACNEAAGKCGVRISMPLAEAAALASRVHERSEMHQAALIQPHDPATDLAALASLAEHCERFSPLVGWRTVEGGPRSKVPGPKSTAQGRE